MNRASLALLFFGLAPFVAQASIVYTNPANQGTQSWGGNLGLRFDVVSPIEVTALGVFNASGSGTIAGTIQVVIYNTTTNTQVTPVVTFHGTYPTAGLGYDVFQSIAPVELAPGDYQVVAVGFNPSDMNGNLNTGSSSGPILNNLAGAITFAGASYDGNTTLDDPQTCAGCQPLPRQSQQFDAGTFEVVPEPSYFPATMLLFGLATVAANVRRARLRARG